MTKEDPIIEFYGLSGVGKTTLARGVIKALEKQGIPYQNRVDGVANRPRLIRILMKSSYVLREMLAHPVLCLKGFKLILKTEQGGLLDFIKVIFNLYFITGLLREGKGKSSPSMLLDQGLFQALWSINDTGKSPVDLEKILENRPLPDGVVLVVAPERVKLCQSGAGDIERFIHRLGLPMLRIENDSLDHLEERVRAIIEWMMAL